MPEQKEVEVMKLTEKQKNCPYCHKPYKPFISTGMEPAGALNKSSYYVGISNVLGEGPITETTMGIINVLKVPSCPFCNRPLNEEEK
ncbi:hypothetical protein L2520_03800 [Limosilactobacillus vaginalis]|uniref:Uncharacterized protein n=1 Tax=Limosilactobacillus vaginalis TaxID=1633 RepID=A0ABT4K6N1_9LACO|nr:hypothetical protein [Limosilactobacillus vaginalis]MCZ3746547.1 hypothetical protein [Limosilactobacillus vaginalis]MCZ3751561.1 hypothetical protein [Limosilactobacillus vaginalis]MCZ3753247.1 hypothetical protein [Limosilactobacillus vaginalis]MCZ3755067.1 hypothetical protein [Limosilactobacillus vaginalis]MCZ3756733.1 hypothetical protein [Limosilactobacillus vaginalis]